MQFNNSTSKKMTTLLLRNSILRATFIAGLLPALVLLLSIQTSHAGSATWQATPATGDWNTAANWTAGGPPNGSADTATFAFSNITGVFLSALTEVNGIVFNSGASAFTITASPALQLTISGAGITNNSGITQNFVTGVDALGNAGVVQFTNSASAGTLVSFTNNGVIGPQGGATEFFNTSTAGNCTFINNPGAANGGGGGETYFVDTASAGTATFINNASTISGAIGGFMVFFTGSIAGNGVFTNNGAAISGGNGGYIVFLDTSTAAHGTFTNNGASVSNAGSGSTGFSGSSTASSGIFTNNAGTVSGAAGGETYFADTASAGTATFINNGAAVIGGNAGFMIFFAGSTAGNAVFNNNGATASGAGTGFTVFNDTSTAGSAMIDNNAGTVSGAAGGDTFFNNSSNAGSDTINNNGATASGADGGVTEFFNTSNAGSATINNNGATVSGAGTGLTQFNDTSTADSSTLIANGGVGGAQGGFIHLIDNTTGGTSRIEVFGNGRFDISTHNAPGLTVGSIEGTGNVFLGAMNLTVGTNNLDTTFSGVIQDGGVSGGSGGSLTKIGSGTLRLTGASTYTGGTTISAGRLLANNSTGSATGSGAVTVNNTATLGGNGTIHLDAGLGASLINNGTIAPGDAVGQLNVDGPVSLGSTSDLSIEIGGTNQGVNYDLLNITNGALTLNGALNVRLINGFTPQQSDTFTIVATPSSIGGTFTNVQSGGRLNTADGSGSFQVTYSGINNAILSDNVILSNFGPPGAPMAQDAFSRKTHGGAGTFDIPLPLFGNVGVECRSGGATNNYQMIIDFATTVTVQSASVTSGTGSVSSFSVSGSQVTVNLTGVINVQRITMTLHNVNNGTTTGDVPVSMGVLIGDVNGNATVNSSDVSLTKSQVGAPVSGSNFREDVNANGTISSTDVALVKSKVGTALPP
jgi:autotransporter-associated beta strand protein